MAAGCYEGEVHAPFSQSLSEEKEGEAATEVVLPITVHGQQFANNFHWHSSPAASNVTEREELMGRMSCSSRLPQYLQGWVTLRLQLRKKR